MNQSDGYLNNEMYEPAGNALSIVSFICGILSVTLCVFSGIPQIIGIITGCVALKKKQKKWMAIGGIVMCVIGLLVGGAIGVILGVSIALGMMPVYF